MDSLTWLRQSVLCLHALAFAIALATVLREDLALLRTRRVDLLALAQAARTLKQALGVLWATGLLLLVFQVGFDASALAASPKLVAKLLVVTVLTLNGVALHVLAFPQLWRAAGGVAAGLPTLAALLGAISTASWLAASFIGLSRLVAPAMRLGDYLALYLVLLFIAAAAALALQRLMAAPAAPFKPCVWTSS